MNVTNEYEGIPDYIRSKINNANVWYQRNVYDYEIKNGFDVNYFFDATYILVGFIRNKPFLRYMFLYTEPYCYNPDRHEDLVDFLNQMVEVSKNDMKVDFISQTSAAALFLDAPEKSEWIPFGSYVVDLTLSEEQLWSNFHSKHRNVIRNAEKRNVVVKIGGKELIKDYMIADYDTCKRSDMTSESENAYISMFDEFGENIVLFMAYLDGKIQGGSIFYYNKAMAYYMHSASVDSPATGAMNLLLWDSMKYFKEYGVKQFSFVGARINEDGNSKYHGIQNFKKRFGGELVVGKMFRVINSEAKYKMYRKLIDIKTRGAAAKDIIDQEIHKWQ